jgi:hypothetical protein
MSLRVATRKQFHDKGVIKSTCQCSLDQLSAHPFGSKDDVTFFLVTF